ncbi:MAG: hypothetical protein U1F43_31850 [Myxococcota bacterium]
MDGDYGQVTKAMKQIIGDATVSGAWALLFVAIVMLVYFLRFRTLLVSGGAGRDAHFWTLGFAVIGIGYLNDVHQPPSSSA